MLHHANALKFKCLLLQNEKPFRKERCLAAVIPHESGNLDESIIP